LFVPNGPDSGIVHLQLLGFWYLSIHHLVKHNELDLFSLWYNGAESTTRILILVLEEGTQIIHFVEVVKCFFFIYLLMTKEKLKIVLIFGIGFRFIYKNPSMLDAWLNRWHPWYLPSCYLTKTAYGGRVACFNGLQ